MQRKPDHLLTHAERQARERRAAKRRAAVEWQALQDRERRTRVLLEQWRGHTSEWPRLHAVLCLEFHHTRADADLIRSIFDTAMIAKQCDWLMSLSPSEVKARTIEREERERINSEKLHSQGK